MACSKLFNFRFWLCVFISAIIGVHFAILLCGNTKLAFVLVLAFLLGVVVLYAISLFNGKLKLGKLVLKLSVFGSIGVLFCCGTLFQSNIKSKIYNCDKVCRIEGTVDKVYDNCFYLSDFCVYEMGSNELCEKFSSDYLVVFSDNVGQSLTAGLRVRVEGRINPTYTLSYEDGELGYVFVTSEEIIEIEQKNFGAKVKTKIQSLFYENVGESQAGVMYAMMFGDKSSISAQTKDSYSVAGMSHLLAVSGLHVGFLLVLISFLVDKIFHAKPKISLVVKILVAFSYLYLCNFAVSAVRATVMAVCLLYARAVGKQGDSLSALSFAGVVLLAVNPLNIFDVGFELSFLVMLSIISLSPLLSRRLGFVMPKWLGDSLTASISAFVGSLPLLLYYFSSVGFLGLIANMIIIPYVSLVFMSMVIAVLISMIVPSFSAVLKVPGFLFGILNKVVLSISNIEQLLHLKINLCGVLLFICGIMLIGQYYIGSKKSKRILAICSVFGVVACMIL